MTYVFECIAFNKHIHAWSFEKII